MAKNKFELSKKQINQTYIKSLKLFMYLVYAIFISSLIALGYIILKDAFPELKEKPQFSKELLDRNFQKRVSSKLNDPDRVEKGIHISTGLVYDKNFQVVRAACTSCHSSKLISQNRATREGWKEMIRWMQATQGLADLGLNESNILDYLSKNYAPKAAGRRANLDIEKIEWYILDLK